MPTTREFSLLILAGLSVWSNSRLIAKIERMQTQYKASEAKSDYLLEIMNREGIKVDEFDMIALKALGIRVEVQDESP